MPDRPQQTPAEPDGPRFPPVIVNPADRSVLVRIPAATFALGSDEQGPASRDDQRPRHTVRLDAYYLGLCAVTNRQYKRFVDATAHRAPGHPAARTPVWTGNTFPPRLADHPVVYVSWDDAAAYCEWAGLSLPTEAQWERAARGPHGFLYPWGDAWDPGRCCCEGRGGDEQTCPVYAYGNGASSYGPLNMSGNVWEWCADRYAPEDYAHSPNVNPPGPTQGLLRVKRGGGWGSGPDDCRAARRYGSPPDRRSSHNGFRVACSQSRLARSTGFTPSSDRP